MIVVKTTTSVCSIPQKGTKRIEYIEQINESANILKQVAEDAPGLKTSNYSLREANGGQNLLWQNHLSRFLAFVTYPPVSTIW